MEKARSEFSSLEHAIKDVSAAIVGLDRENVRQLADAARSADPAGFSDKVCQQVVTEIKESPALSDSEAAGALQVLVLAAKYGAVVVHGSLKLQVSELLQLGLSIGNNDKTVAACALLWGAGAALSPANMTYTVPPSFVWGHVVHRRAHGDQNCTVLHAMARSGRAAACALLLDSGIFTDPEARALAEPRPAETTTVDTPLQLAVHQRHVRVARVLVARGASTERKEITTGLAMRDITVDSHRIDGGRRVGDPPADERAAAAVPAQPAANGMQGQLMNLFGGNFGFGGLPGQHAVHHPHHHHHHQQQAVQPRPPPITEELARALRSKEQESERAVATRFFLLAATAAKEIGALALEKDVLGRLIVNTPKWQHSRRPDHD